MRSQDYDRLYLSPPHLGRHELNYVHKAIEDNWVAPAGPNITGFEADIMRGDGRGALRGADFGHGRHSPGAAAAGRGAGR